MIIISSLSSMCMMFSLLLDMSSAIVLVHCQNSIRCSYISLRHTSKLSLAPNSLEDFSIDDDPPSELPIFKSSREVNDILQQIEQSLKPYKSKSANSRDVTATDTLTSIEDVKAKFSEIMSDVRVSSLTELEKRQVFVETSMLLTDQTVNDAPTTTSESISVAVDKVPTYSSSVSPVVVVMGKGPVSRQIAAIVADLGGAGDFRFLEADQLTVIQEYELKYLLREARSVVVCGDSEQVERRGWLGRPEVQEGDPPLTSAGLKRLLNAVMAESNQRTQPEGRPIKVAVLGKACAPPQSLVGMLSGSGTSRLEEEAVLMCSQRGLAYALVKVGRLLGDDQPVPKNIRDRSREGSNPDPGRSPVLITRSRSVSASEVTYVSLAAQALLRTLSHPHRNASFSVLATRWPGPVRDWHWADQFLKLRGPEMARLRLQALSPRQALLALYRAADRLQSPDSGMVTRVEVGRRADGVRLLFRPPQSSYLSQREERQQEERQRAALEVAKGPRPGGYRSPEQEARDLQVSQPGTASPNPNPSKARKPQEGGLELVVETSPYPRVRVVRCEMGPQTVPKVESERVVLDTVRKYIDTAERDYKILMDRGLVAADIVSDFDRLSSAS